MHNTPTYIQCQGHSEIKVNIIWFRGYFQSKPWKVLKQLVFKNSSYQDHVSSAAPTTTFKVNVILWVQKTTLSFLLILLNTSCNTPLRRRIFVITVLKIPNCLFCFVVQTLPYFMFALICNTHMYHRLSEVFESVIEELFFSIYVTPISK